MRRITYSRKIIDPGLSARENLLKWLDANGPKMAFKARSVSAARAWQRRARAKFLECLGDAPKRVPLKPRILEQRHLDGYTRTTLLLNTAPHLKALCWLCLPDDATDKKPLPAMIAVPGHGVGAKDLLAMNEKGKPRKEGVGYQKDYALQAVRLGYAALVIEPLGFGERRDPSILTSQDPEIGCFEAANVALMLGTTLARIRMNDIQRGLDFLETVDEVDPHRIGLMGLSGGGQMTLWTSAVEKRLKVAVVSGYLNNFRDSIMDRHHCVCNFVPALVQYLDMIDIAAMAAPHPILLESGTEDHIFPIKAARRAIKQLRKIYSLFSASDRIEVDIFKGPHEWSGRKLKHFLAKWL